MKNTILMLEKDGLNSAKILWEFGDAYNFCIAYKEEDFNNLLEIEKPDILIINVDLYEHILLKNLLKFNSNKSIPLIAISENSDLEEKFLKLGVNDFILKPYKSFILKARVVNQLKVINLLNKVKLLSTTDNLTKIQNRQGFELYFNDLYLNVFRNNDKINKFLTVILIDIDKFKNFNDTYGHLVGDIVLYNVANVLNNLGEKENFNIYRWGGEEFVIIAQDLDPKQSFHLGEKVRKTIECKKIKLKDESELNITISVGIFNKLFEKQDSIDYYLNEADNCLYKAKETGRNKTVISYLGD